LRNKAEKLRRDRLNRLIEEMKQLVPVISAKLVTLLMILNISVADPVGSGLNRVSDPDSIRIQDGNNGLQKEKK
jgi:hypothetical protein